MKKLFIYFILFISLFFMVDNHISAISSENIGEGKTVYINVNDGVYLRDVDYNILNGGNGSVHTYTKKDAKTGELIYCADATRGFFSPESNLGEEPWTYSKKADKSDILAFIFENGYYKTEGYGANDYLVGTPNTDYFITTMAIWKYTIPGNYLDKLDLTTGKYDGVESEASRKLTKLINDASNTNNHKNPSLNLNISNKNMTLSSDGKYYVSGPIKIEGKDLNSKVTITVGINGGMPAYLITKDINSTTDEDSFYVGNTVYIKIPINQITGNTNVSIKASASGTKGSVHIWEYSGQGESPLNIQSIATYTPETLKVNSELTLTISKTDVNISKQDITNNKEVDGAHLVIKNSAGTTVEKWYSTKETKTFTLDPGTYTLEETIAPQGYIKTTEKITFVVNSDGTVSVDNKNVDKVIMKNKPIMVTISKTDIAGTKELAGAHLKVTDKNGNVVTDMTGNKLEWVSGTTAKSFHLKAGTYILEETIAPDGYIKSAEKITFVVKEDGTVSVDSKNVDKVVMKNDPSNVVISKTDIVGASELEGATLRITDKSGNISTDVNGNKLEWISQTKPKTFQLKAGTYILEETIAPDGYIKSTEKIIFVVNSDGTVSVDDKKVDKVVMENKPIIVTISKTDITGTNELEDASLKVTDEEGNVVTDISGKKLEWISTNEPAEFHLKAGTYILEETIAPLGYIKSTEKIIFVVGEDGKVTIDEEEVDKVVMKNAPIKIIISKQSINSTSELKDAKLRIIGIDGKTIKDINGELLEWTTNGKIKTIQLAPGTYILEEIEAPKGYELSDKKIEFIINEEGKLFINEKEVQDNTIVFKNTPEPKQVETGSYYIYIIGAIGVITIGISSYFIYNKYRK